MWSVSEGFDGYIFTQSTYSLSYNSSTNSVTMVDSSDEPCWELFQTYSPYNIVSKSTYILRASSQSLLTFNYSTSGNNLNLGAIGDTWNNYSQAFLIEEIMPKKYQISAILTTAQSNGAYYIDHNLQSNTLKCTSNGTLSLSQCVPVTDNHLWIACEINGNVIFRSVANTLYALSYSSNSISTELTSSIEWDISQFGVATPLVKLNDGAYSGGACVTQIMNYFDNNTYTNYVSAQNFFNNTIEKYSTQGTTENYNNLSNKKIREYLGTNVNSTSTSSSYKYIPFASFDDLADYTNYLNTSLVQGYPVILETNGNYIGNLPYYLNHTFESKKRIYITIVGYDSITGKVLLSDCHNGSYYGLHLVDIQGVYDAMLSWIGHYN